MVIHPLLVMNGYGQWNVSKWHLHKFLYLCIFFTRNAYTSVVREVQTSKYSVVFDKLPITVILHDIICTLMWVFDFMPNSGITQQSLKRVMHGTNMTKDTHFKSCLPLVQ